MGILAWGVSSQAFPQPVESLPRLGDRCYMPTYRWRASCLQGDSVGGLIGAGSCPLRGRRGAVYAVPLESCDGSAPRKV